MCYQGKLLALCPQDEQVSPKVYSGKVPSELIRCQMQEHESKPPVCFLCSVTYYLPTPSCFHCHVYSYFSYLFPTVPFLASGSQNHICLQHTLIHAANHITISFKSACQPSQDSVWSLPALGKTFQPEVNGVTEGQNDITGSSLSLIRYDGHACLKAQGLPLLLRTAPHRSIP